MRAPPWLSLRDLTESRRVERMRVDFVANASHELRTPLASLLGFVETLQGPARDDAKARERFLDIMREQAQRMARLVDDLLSLSRIEQHLHLRPRHAGRSRHSASPISSTRSAPHGRGQRRRAEARRRRRRSSSAATVTSLPRVAENLIENAIKYGAPDGPVEDLAVAPLGALGASCSVRDDGPGIAPEHLPRLTERFYRVDAGKSRAKGGTGLGLAIVKHIVARHRGRLPSIQRRQGRDLSRVPATAAADKADRFAQ